MDITTDEEQTEQKTMMNCLEKVGDMTLAVDMKGEELYKLVTEGSVSKEHVLGHVLLLENLAGKLMQAAISFRHSYILYTERGLEKCYHL